jgi:hypothetical protein
MMQVKHFMSAGKAYEWLKNNQYKEIIDILFIGGGFALVYEKS